MEDEYPKLISENRCKTYQIDDGHLIHIIESGFEDFYLVVEEDAFSMSQSSDKVHYMAKLAIKKQYGVIL